MAIGPYHGRSLEELWMVLQDGIPVLQGRPKAEAEAFAKKIGDGLPKVRAGSAIYMPHIELKYDAAAMKKRDDLYTEFRGYRRGD